MTGTLRVFRCRACGETYRHDPGRCPLCAWAARCRSELVALMDSGAEIASLDVALRTGWVACAWWVLRGLGGRAS